VSGDPYDQEETPVDRPTIRTNEDLAQALDIDATMASRLRNGHRLPSASLMYRIHEVFKVPLDEIHEARNNGHEAFGEFVRERLFSEAPV
jgi:transcriptional regulator with XRE-family HTH domain